MTGSAAPSPPVSGLSQRAQDSSSNTDTSSISRQSLYDPYLDIHPETPRSSFDDHESLSTSEDDEERSTLMTGTARLDDLAPPAPPKHSHGNLSGWGGPQTVSFADFERSSTESRASAPPAQSKAASNTKTLMLSRSQSDLNKPLPPPPISPAQATFGVATKSQEPSTQPTPSISGTEEGTQTKRAPPPPASRRAGHIDPSHGQTTGLPNAAQDSTHDEQVSTPLRPLDVTTKSSAISAPPPPPSRKTRPTSQTAVPTVENLPHTSSPAPNAAEAKGVPPPPPRRNPSKAGGAINRTPSSASQSSTSRNDATSSTTHNAPPAPPRRRGAQPKRDSIEAVPSSTGTNIDVRRPSDNSEGRKDSETSAEGARLDSHSTLQQVVVSTEAVKSVDPVTGSDPSNDMLADLSAFQAEIDALRAKAERRG